MDEFTINEILNMQKTLQEKYADKWGDLSPEQGKDYLLWMIGEIGEVIDIVKKHGSTKVNNSPELKAHLVEELADVLMYYGDILLCFDITSDELKNSYVNKFNKNLQRW